jgi:hypothetical protein
VLGIIKTYCHFQSMTHWNIGDQKAMSTVICQYNLWINQSHYLYLLGDKCCLQRKYMCRQRETLGCRKFPQSVIKLVSQKWSRTCVTTEWYLFQFNLVCTFCNVAKVLQHHLPGSCYTIRGFRYPFIPCFLAVEITNMDMCFCESRKELWINWFITGSLKIVIFVSFKICEDDKYSKKDWKTQNVNRNACTEVTRIQE